jgi:succinyl-CoA synthetase beta subunit
MDIKGHTVHKVWVEAASDIKAEYYASFTLDRSAKKHLGMISAKGGVDIEEVAATEPEAVVKIHIDPVIGLTNWQATEMVYRANLHPEAARGAVALLKKLYQAFVEFDCDLVEVNPLILTTDGNVVALDAKVALDENGFFRHPDFPALADDHVIPPVEKMAKERDLNFIKLDGDIGIVGNGAGLVMSTLDVVSLVGGRASNFLDVGGGASAETITAALEILMQDPSVKTVLINIFGGITRGDLVAQGILEAFESLDLPWPIVVRLDGTNAEEGRDILAKVESDNLIPAATMREAAEKAVELARGEGV